MDDTTPAEASKAPHPLAGVVGSTTPEATRALFGRVLPALVYANSTAQQLAGMLGDLDARAAAVRYADDLLARMNARDPMEEMLIAQALMAHARVLHLTALTNSQELLDSIRTVNEYADRATNTYRRLMLALAEYRRPPRAGDSFTAIKHANIAGRQVVMNLGASQQENTTNELGSADADAPRHAREAPEALPADTGGPCIPPGYGGSREALGTVRGAKDARRQGPKQ